MYDSRHRESRLECGGLLAALGARSTAHYGRKRDPLHMPDFDLTLACEVDLILRLIVRTLHLGPLTARQFVLGIQLDLKENRLV
ncbi:MAG TPA: hypothetical protein VMI06_04905 [Terriglobia bacterium]|nr:hypothetical protein [Terriglobia bacterium]